MAWFTEYSDMITGESFAAYSSTSIEYVDDMGNTLEVPQHAAWCIKCGTIVNAEAFTTLLPMRRRMIELALVDPESKEAWMFPTRENALEARQELERLETFLSNRHSRPRCLECFSDELVEIPDEDEFGLPNGRRLKRCGFGHASMKIEPCFKLTPDGTIAK